MPPFVTYIQKASRPVSRVLFRGKPPEEAISRMTTAAICLHAGKLFLDLDREEVIDGDEDGQEREASASASAAFSPERSGSTGGLS